MAGAITLVEMESPFEIGLMTDCLSCWTGQGPRASGKCNRDDHEERWDGSQKPPEDVAQHENPNGKRPPGFEGRAAHLR
jgi:hypothetical protein